MQHVANIYNLTAMLKTQVRKSSVPHRHAFIQFNHVK